MAGRTLHVRCATWEQVDQFTTRKLRKGRLLSMKVPFVARAGSAITLGLELPNEMVIAIDGSIAKASPVDNEPTRTWIEIELSGFTDDVRARLEVLTRQGDIEPARAPAAPAAPVRRPTLTGMDRDLPDDERELFQHLSAELRRLRQAAVHEVLDVEPDAGPSLVREHWKDLIRRHHPDLVARRNAPALTHLAEELTILANRAYDRMRAKLVASGRASVAGPSVATPPGWLVGFDDLQSGDGLPSAHQRGSGPIFQRPGTPPPEQKLKRAPAPPPSAGAGSDAYEDRARASLADGDPATAREILAAALVVYPRSKPLRSLYYVATALCALADGEVMLAQSQLETALAHHDQCVEAVKLLDHVKKHGTQQADLWWQVFR